MSLDMGSVLVGVLMMFVVDVALCARMRRELWRRQADHEARVDRDLAELFPLATDAHRKANQIENALKAAARRGKV
jgi:hypothetical protein